MVAPLVTAKFHGDRADGPDLPEPKIKQRKACCDFIIETVMNTDDVTLIATGPLTNIAEAISREPRVAERLKKYILCMVRLHSAIGLLQRNLTYSGSGGCIQVFNSGLLVNMCGINLTRQCRLTFNMQKFREIGTKAANLAADLLEFFIGSSVSVSKLTGANLHDACPVAWIINPKLIKAVPMHIDIELKGEYTRGMTVCDYRHLRGTEPHIDLYRTPTMEPRGEALTLRSIGIDFERFMDLLYETLKNYN